jgi:hypothetical protein
MAASQGYVDSSTRQDRTILVSQKLSHTRVDGIGQTRTQDQTDLQLERRIPSPPASSQQNHKTCESRRPVGEEPNRVVR